MNILNLLTKKRNIVGIEINDQAIRIAYLNTKQKKSDKNNPVTEELVLIEEKLPNNIISNGIILEKSALSQIIKNTWNKNGLKKSYAVVSIQEDKIYSHTLSFPGAIDESKLKEAVSLAIDFQIPIKKEDYYIGWELTNNSNSTSKVLISAISKNIVNDYIHALDNAGVKVLALESNISSVSRSIKLDPKEVTLISKENQNSISIICFKDNTYQFSRTIPKTYITEKNTASNEINKLKNSFESEFKVPIKEINISNGEVKEEYTKYKAINESETKSKWLIVLGAFIRGEIQQGKDNQISLLPVGTAEAYSYQKIKTFINLIRNILIGVSLFFLITFIASYLFIFSIYQKINNSKNSITVYPISGDMAEKEILIKKVNSLTQMSEIAMQNSIKWSILIDEINSKRIEGITISDFRVPSANESISIIGISANRDTLNKFKKLLEESIYLSEVELPITNLEQKGDIPFSISFKIKDPSMLYFK